MHQNQTSLLDRLSSHDWMSICEWFINLPDFNQFYFFFFFIQIIKYNSTDHSPLSPADKTSVSMHVKVFFARQSKPSSHPWTNSDFVCLGCSWKSENLDSVQYGGGAWCRLTEWRVTVLQIEAVSSLCFLLALNSYVLFSILLGTGSQHLLSSTNPEPGPALSK